MLSSLHFSVSSSVFTSSDVSHSPAICHSHPDPYVLLSLSDSIRILEIFFFFFQRSKNTTNRRRIPVWSGGGIQATSLLLIFAPELINLSDFADAQTDPQESRNTVAIPDAKFRMHQLQTLHPSFYYVAGSKETFFSKCCILRHHMTTDQNNRAWIWTSFGSLAPRLSASLEKP